MSEDIRADDVERDILPDTREVWAAVMMQLGLCIVTLVLVLWGANFKEGTGLRFAHFGPGTDRVPISVVGVHIHSWPRWSVLILLLIIMEIVQTYSHKKYKRWYRYSVRARGKSGMSKRSTLFLVTMFRICTWFPQILKVLLVIETRQLQFLLPALLGRIVTSNIVDANDLVT